MSRESQKMEKISKLENPSNLPIAQNPLLIKLNSTEYLAEWTQRELTNHISDIVLHFLLSFPSNHTKRSYLFDIKEFICFTNSININLEYISQIDEKLLILWHDFLTEKNNLTQKTIRRKLNSLSSLLEFCKKRKLITTNPMIFIQKPRYVEESKTNAFTVEEVKQILFYLETESETLFQENNKSRKYKSAFLNYTILVTLFSVGMRVNELCELKMKDIEFSSDFTRLHMTSKGNKEHSPIIHPKASQIIKKYIEQMRMNAKDEDYLFIRTQSVSNATKLSQVGIYKMVTEISKRLGIEKKVSPHSCRASLATILHNQGVPIGQIQTLLNHQEITTTAMYIKKADEIKESAAMKLDLSKF